MVERLRGNAEFLGLGATRERIMEALFVNMREWIVCSSEMNGGEVVREGGATWVYNRARKRDGIIAFPQFRPGRENKLLDRMVQYYREGQPERDILYWTREPVTPSDLEARLIARGFEWNWQPHWMGLALHHLAREIPLPDGVRIECYKSAQDWDAPDLPYYDLESVRRNRQEGRGSAAQVWHFGAWDQGTVVGHCILHLTRGELGVAGIFDVGVVPTARNRGIGKALVYTACQFAEGLGCQYAVLNATPMGEPVYYRLGFVSLGHGPTWFLSAQTLSQPASDAELVMHAEAVCRGDWRWLQRSERSGGGAVLEQLLPSGWTLLQIAARMYTEGGSDSERYRRVASWLLEQGAVPDLISLWELGWRERAYQLVKRVPESVNQRRGRWQLTPLHIAVERNDQELARLILQARPDLTLEDTQYHATALGWAEHMQRQAIVHMILGRY